MRRPEYLAITLAIAVLSAVLLVSRVHAEESDPAALAAAVADVPTTLAKGLQASERAGKPISGKFEIEDGKLQLSVYTMTADGYTEVIVAPDNGNVVTTEKITDSDDLKAATEQKAAMEKATLTLVAATMWYGVYDVADRVVSFATAGHHPAYLLAAGSARPVPLGTRNPSIGIGADREVASARAQVAPGSSLFLFSDGVFEITDHEGREWDLSQVLSLLPMMATPNGPRRLYETVRMAARPGPLEDDFSALAIRFV
jgi:hypothetical protein